MKRADQIAGVVLLAFSLAAVLESSKLPMVHMTTPGPGFMPFWLSLGLVVLSALLLYDGLRRPASTDEGVSWPRGRPLLRIATPFVGLAAYILVMPVVGYILSTWALMGLLVWLIGSYRWYWSAGLALAIAVGLYGLFTLLLSLELPTGLLIIP